jgi:hypothetical protein
MDTSLSDVPPLPLSNFANEDLTSLTSGSKIHNDWWTKWSRTDVCYYTGDYKDDESWTLLATIQALKDTVYVHSFLSFAGTIKCIERGGPDGNMVPNALELCKRKQDRLSERKKGSSKQEDLVDTAPKKQEDLVDTAFREYFFASKSDPIEAMTDDMVTELLVIAPDMPRAELQKVAQAIRASKLQLEDQELEQLLVSEYEVLRVRKSIDTVREMRLRIEEEAAAAAEKQRRDEEAGLGTLPDSNDV